jgi:uncharacterized RDD family membrane protein YckC
MYEPGGPRAGFWRRFWALILDGIVLAIVATVLEAIVGRSLGGIVALALYIGYFGYFIGSPSGQTIGKRALGIRVIDAKTGGSIGFSRAVLRFFAAFLSAIVFYLGYLWMLWDPEKQTWHDKIAGDVVVPVSAYPVESWPGRASDSVAPVTDESAMGSATGPAATTVPAPRSETLEEEQQRRFEEREKQWGG